MDKEEHQNLVKTVRDVHNQLRKAYLKSMGNFETIWANHVHSKEQRQSYANAVYRLAMEKWTMKDSRIHWCYKTALEFFFHGGLQQALQREMRIALKNKMYLPNDKNNIETSQPLYEVSSGHMHKLRLLDVGSCYNAFAAFEKVIAVPIDLTPATDDVYKCDFLSLKVREDLQKDMNLIPPPGAISELPSASFHVVVFSLVLEYVPASSYRLLFCKKAWKLLVKNGILLIVTPDSKSQHHNAPMMRNWKTAIESLGFKRYKYEKLKHLHCMAYRKNCEEPPAETDGLEISELMFIPQDFKDFTDIIIEYSDRTLDEDTEVKILFDVLPSLQ